MSKTILIVEDEALLAMDMEMTLTELGHQSVIVGSVAAAETALQQHSFDAAVLDVHLRDEPSAPVVAMLRSRGIPFVICSGSSFGDFAEIFGGATLISKPFHTSDLVHAIEKLGSIH